MANVNVCDICGDKTNIKFKIKAKRLNLNPFFIQKWEKIDLCYTCYKRLILSKDKTALDKQNSKKPHKSESGMFYICPCCDRFIDRNEQAHGNIDIPYCKWCGQKLDWEHSNE